MPRPLFVVAVLLAVASVPLPLAIGQMAGSRGGTEGASADVADLPLLQPPLAEGYITIEGRGSPRAAHGRPCGAGRDE